MRVHTDAGIVGVGEVDSAPEVVKAVIEAPARTPSPAACAHVLIGQDPLDVERLWQKMYRGVDLLRPPRRGPARDQRHRHRPLGHQG